MTTHKERIFLVLPRKIAFRCSNVAFGDTIWEQLTHCPSTILLKIRQIRCSAANLFKIFSIITIISTE